MLNGFPCPNPTCSHTFPTAAVTGVSALTCPRCGTVFQFRSPTAAPPQPRPMPAPAYPAAAQQRVQPVRVPVAAPAAPPQLPRAIPAQNPMPLPQAMRAPAPTGQPAGAHQLPTYERFDLDAMAAAQGAPISSGSTYRRSDGSGMWAFKIALVMLIVGGAALGGVYFAYKRHLFDADKPADTSNVTFKPFRSDAFNYSFQCPNPDWRTDDDPFPVVRGHIALKRSDPQAGMAIIVKDFKNNPPRDADLIDMMLARLRERIPDVGHEPREEQVQLGGKRAVRVLFQGSVNKLGKIDGEAYLMIHGNIGYAFVTWAPDDVWNDSWFAKFDDLRKGFALLNNAGSP